MHFSSYDRWEFRTLIGLRDEDTDINTMIATYNIAVAEAASEIRGRNVAGKSRGSPEMFSTFDLFDQRRFEEEVVQSRRRKRIQGSKQEDSGGNEESKRGLGGCSMRRD